MHPFYTARLLNSLTTSQRPPWFNVVASAYKGAAANFGFDD